jgi:hypothetical protein
VPELVAPIACSAFVSLNWQSRLDAQIQAPYETPASQYPCGFQPHSPLELLTRFHDGPKECGKRATEMLGIDKNQIRCDLR